MHESTVTFNPRLPESVHKTGDRLRRRMHFWTALDAVEPKSARQDAPDAPDAGDVGFHQLATFLLNLLLSERSVANSPRDQSGGEKATSDFHRLSPCEAHTLPSGHQSLTTSSFTRLMLIKRSRFLDFSRTCFDHDADAAQGPVACDSGDRTTGWGSSAIYGNGVHPPARTDRVSARSFVGVPSQQSRFHH